MTSGGDKCDDLSDRYRPGKCSWVGFVPGRLSFGFVGRLTYQADGYATTLSLTDLLLSDDTFNPAKLGLGGISNLIDLIPLSTMHDTVYLARVAGSKLRVARLHDVALGVKPAVPVRWLSTSSTNITRFKGVVILSSVHVLSVRNDLVHSVLQPFLLGGEDKWQATEDYLAGNSKEAWKKTISTLTTTLCPPIS